MIEPKRTTLARLLGRHFGTSAAGDDYLWALADVVLAHVHPVVETAEQLDTMPPGSVAIDGDGVARQKDADGYWWGRSFGYDAIRMASMIRGPFTVLHEGSTDG